MQGKFTQQTFGEIQIDDDILLDNNINLILPESFSNINTDANFNRVFKNKMYIGPVILYKN